MSSITAIFFNGPPRAGKDTATMAIMEAFPNIRFKVIKFTEPVKNMTHRKYGLDVPHDFYESLKDTRLDDFDGLTPREAYISFSTKARQTFGEDVFARMIAEQISRMENEIIICPDVGYNFEAEAIISRMDPARALIGRIAKEGHTFEGDCRVRIDLPQIATFDIENVQGQEKAFKAKIVQRVAGLVHSHPLPPRRVEAEELVAAMRA